jgi:hypothetical protein
MNDLQQMRDRIDNQMRQIQQNQLQQPMTQPITQNFQLAPTQNTNELESKYAESIDEVKNTFVIKTGLFINKDKNTLWIKDITGDIKTYKLEEIIELDEKDKTIIDLQKQINQLKGELNNAKSDVKNVDATITSKKSTKLPNDK